MDQAVTLRHAAVGAWLVVIGVVTLTGAPEQVARIQETAWYCLACGDAGVTDVLLNLLLFLPLGLFARAERWSLARTTVAVVFLTVTIELCQSILLAGRDASLSDVLANSVGGVGGWLLLPTLLHALHPSRRFASRAVIIIGSCSALVWLATGFGLRVALSDTAPWVGQPMRLWPGHVRYPGTLQRASLSGVGVEDDPLSRLPDRLDSLALTLDLTHTDPLVTRKPISLLRVVDGNRQLQLTVGIRGRDLLLEHRVAASRLLLRTPVWRFDDAAITPVNIPWRYQFLRRADRVVLQSGPVAGPTTELVVPLSVALGWAFVHPFAPPVGESAPWWTLLWIGCWLGPLGWFAGIVGGKQAVGFGALAVGSMLLASQLSGVPSRPDELLAAAIILTLSSLLGRARGKREGPR